VALKENPGLCLEIENSIRQAAALPEVLRSAEVDYSDEDD
jgi:hypothetical protein